MGKAKTGVDVHYSQRYSIPLAITLGSIMGPIDASIVNSLRLQAIKPPSSSLDYDMLI